MPDGVGLDHWFWGEKIPAGSKRDYIFYLSNIANVTQAATVRVYLHGRTDDIVNPDHRTRINLNGYPLGEVVWDGQRPVIHSFENVSHAILKSGSNTVTFEEVADPGVVVDSIFVNWIEVDYYETFVAEGNRLKFTERGNGTFSFSITNFTHPTLMVFNVSNPFKVRRLTGPKVTSSGSTYTATFSDQISGGATYLVIAIPEIKDFDIPSAIRLTSPSLKSADNGADYIIITHENFKSSVSPLAQHRERQGYRVKVVTTQEIYDEFSGGIFTPQAIKDFLKYAYEKWKGPASEFVLLIGDANLDYKDYWKTGQINYVPTYLVETTIVGETPSDHWFVTLAGDDPLPDMFIGRMPAKTVDEVKAMVDKVITYETGGKGEWRYRVMFAAGTPDPMFEEYTDEWIKDHLPVNYTPYRLFVSTYGDKTQSRMDLLKNMNDGTLIASYLGHGNIDRWIGSLESDLFKSEDIAALTNQGKFPFVVAFNCLNGLFAMPSEGGWIPLPDGNAFLQAVPLPEALLKEEDRGVLAMWSPSAFAYPSEQRWIGHELFSGLFQQGNNILGSVTTLAKVNAFVKKGVYVENLDVFTFFGDPATRLALDIEKDDQSTASSSGGGGCFIATAAYGSYLHPYVEVLRDFRDKILLQRDWGKVFVDTYYRLSPPAAEWIAERGWARAVMRVFLLPLIFWAWLAVGASLWVQGAVFGLSLLCGTGLFMRKRLRW